MKNIAILALKNASVSSIFDARAVFQKANELLLAAKKKPLFKVSIVGAEEQVALEKDLVTIQAELSTNSLDKLDLIIIPSLTGDMMSATHNNRFFVDWIIKQYRQGAEIASLCTGAFMLAFSGLLKNKKCTTHWRYANEFRHFYPNVD